MSASENGPAGLTIAVVGSGDMGGSVAGCLRGAGADVVAAGAGRGAETRARIAGFGLRDLGTVAACAAEADIFLSIMPPEAAEALAAEVAAALTSQGRPTSQSNLLYADCNAVSPATVAAIAERVTAAGARFVDAGIIGLNPDSGRPTRFYASGPEAGKLKAIEVEGRISVPVVGPEIGQASGLKMCYAALTKGTDTLRVAILLTARELGLYDQLLEEWGFSQAAKLESMRQGLPTLAADSGRWIREMEEIARTFEAAGVTGDFHKGAAFIHRTLAASPLGAETRATADRARSLEQSLELWASALPKHRKA